MKYRDKIRVLIHLADVHIGAPAMTAEEIKYQLFEKFIQPLSHMAIIDVITINGDLSHCALSFNSKYSQVYLWLYDSIISIAKKHSATVIVIKGTLSHDFDQIENLKGYKGGSVYFIDEPTVLNVKGIKIYCLPDMHIKSIEEESALYKYDKNEFDIILGHGTVTETQFVEQDGEYGISKNVVYDTKELHRMCKGPIIFGHIHTYMKIKDRLYYSGSFPRFAHGEELSKGFLITAYIPETGQFIVERVINDLAFNFNTYSMKYSEFDKLEAEEIIKNIEKFIKDFSVDKLCLEISYENTDVNVAKINILRNYFSRNKIVNKFKFKSLSKKETELLEQGSVEIDEKKKYLIDKSIRFEEKLQRFIKEEYGTEIPIEKIEHVFYSKDLLLKGE